MSNKELANVIYENTNIEFGMIDKPNIIITNGTINYDNGMCNEWNPKAKHLFAQDLKGKFKFGMILRKSTTGIQCISQEYIEYLLEHNAVDRDKLIELLEDTIEM